MFDRFRETHIKFLHSAYIQSAPRAPQNLISLGVIDANTIGLQWDDLATEFDSYTVYVKNTATGIIEQTITGIMLSEADVMGLTTDVKYEFWVVSVRDGIESSQSNHIFETPIQLQPDAPTGFNVEVVDAAEGLKFNGVDQIADLGYLGNFGSQHLALHTLEMKFKSTDSSMRNIFGGLQNSISAGNNFGQIWAVMLNRRYNTEVEGVITYYIRTDGPLGDNRNALVAYTDVLPLNDGEEHHIALKSDKANATLEIIFDGVPQTVYYSVRGTQTDFVDFTVPVCLGGSGNDDDAGNDQYTFSACEASDVRIWKGLRDNQKIIDNINSELNPTDEPDLFRYYPCNDGSGDVLSEEVIADNGILIGNVNDNMWVGSGGKNAKCTWNPVADVDGYNVYLSDDGGITFTKQNTELIPATEYIIENIPDGSYEAYSTAVKNGVESEPSNVEVFRVGGFKFYRLEIYEHNGENNSGYSGLRELILAGSIGGPSLAATLPGTATASSEFPTGSAGFAFLAFDGSLYTGGGYEGWCSDNKAEDPFPTWVQYEFDTGQKVMEYGVTPHSNRNVWEDQSATHFKLLGSNDGVNWTTLDEQTGVVWAAEDEVKRFPL